MVEIYVGYQVFGNKSTPCGRAKAELKDFQNLMDDSNDYFVLHFWRADRAVVGDRYVDDHCITVTRVGRSLAIWFHAYWLGGYFNHYTVPIDHQIEIGGGPNHERGSREYNSFTWYIHDKTTNEYIKETKDTPATWRFEAVDAALEMGDIFVPNGLKKAMTKLVALDENLKPVHLPRIFKWREWSIPNGCNGHKEIYSHDGYEVECWAWKTKGDQRSYTVDVQESSFIGWMKNKGEGITFDDIIDIVQGYKGKKDLGFKPTLDNLIDVVQLYLKS